MAEVRSVFSVVDRIRLRLSAFVCGPFRNPGAFGVLGGGVRILRVLCGSGFVRISPLVILPPSSVVDFPGLRYVVLLPG